MTDSPFGELGGFIRNRRNDLKMSLRKLSDLVGVSNPYLSQIERGIRKPSAEILQALASGLAVSAETLYVKAGLLKPSVGPTGVEDAIAKDAKLDATQRDALLRIYRSFIGDPPA